ncbi:MAG: hypothetical protein AB1730_15285 [Myxococcota bacterium]
MVAKRRAAVGVDDQLHARLRGATPSKKVRDDLLARHTVDEVYGEPPAAGEKLSADHIVSVKEITNMEGFNKLTYRQQLEVLNFPENFMAMHKSVNSSKGARSWTTWDGMVSDKRFPKVKPEVRQSQDDPARGRHPYQTP